ncbi:cytochrome P450 3A11 [Caerostris extrusa]|uniref:Cytochrome P450 3A11 n=1 Tax=Caerostris extrusa TaxID=172846 RepID=A0AAV4S8A8_CAEEX|nr:cytochrome P450 3A11 [Caerostris extrusa]
MNSYQQKRTETRSKSRSSAASCVWSLRSFSMMLDVEFTQNSLLLVFLIGLASILFYWYSTKNLDYWKKRNVPFAKPYPFPFHEIELKRYLELGHVYGHFEGTRPVLSVAEPELLKNIFIKDFLSFPNRRLLVSGDEVVDKMVSVVNGEDWKRIRTIITPTFSTGKIKGQVHVLF